jgi:hypothetical protein
LNWSLRPHHESMTASHKHMTNVFVGSLRTQHQQIFHPTTNSRQFTRPFSLLFCLVFFFGPRLLIDIFVDERRKIESSGTAIAPRVESSHFFGSSRNLDEPYSIVLRILWGTSLESGGVIQPCHSRRSRERQPHGQRRHKRSPQLSRRPAPRASMRRRYSLRGFFACEAREPQPTGRCSGQRMS